MTENQPYECITCTRVVPTLPGVRPHPLAPCCAHVDVDGRPCPASTEAEIFPRMRIIEWGAEFDGDPFAAVQLDAAIRAPRPPACTCDDPRGIPVYGVSAGGPVYVTCAAGRDCRALETDACTCGHTRGAHDNGIRHTSCLERSCCCTEYEAA